MNYLIKIPKNIKIYCKNNNIYFQGKFGNESLNYLPLKIQILENNLEIQNIYKENLCFCQTFITLIQQSIRGVLSGYKKQLELKGIGFKCKIIHKKLELKLGFSHLIYKDIPEYLVIKCIKNKIVIKGSNKQKINEFANLIQNLKIPDPYKGKGIFLKNKMILRKQGKKVK